MVLLVDNAGGCGHPLNVAGADFSSGAGGVAVLDLSLVDDGYGFKPAMGMLADAAALGGRGEFFWAGVVEQQERAECLA